MSGGNCRTKGDEHAARVHIACLERDGSRAGQGTKCFSAEAAAEARMSVVAYTGHQAGTDINLGRRGERISAARRMTFSSQCSASWG